MKPFTNKHSIAAGSPFHMGGSGKSPLYQDDLREGEKKEGRPIVEVSKTGDMFRGRTTTVKTTQPVIKTEEGNRAYAAKSQKEKDIQDAKYKRNMTSTRTFSSSGIKQPSMTPSSDIKINKAKLKERLDPVEKFKYTKERGGSQYGQGTSSGSTGYVFDEKGIKNVLNTGTYVKLEGVRKSGEKFDVYQRGKSTGLASKTTVKEDLAKGRKQASADKSAKAKADILAKRKQKAIIKDKREG
jgi:hypothetical protein